MAFQSINIFPFGRIPRWLYAIFRVWVYLTGISLVIAVVLLFVWPFALVAFWDRLAQTAHSPWKRAALTGALTVLGFLLYLARRFARLWYGAAETVLGIAFCWAGLLSVSAVSWASAASVVGGVYIIVRGLDNFQQGIEARKADV
jgi:hypothetical protein